MAKLPTEMTGHELAQEMCKRPDSLDHLTAKAEMERRRSVLQFRTTIAAAVSAVASALAACASAYVAIRGFR